MKIVTPEGIKSWAKQVLGNTKAVENFPAIYSLYRTFFPDAVMPIDSIADLDDGTRGIFVGQVIGKVREFTYRRSIDGSPCTEDIPPSDCVEKTGYVYQVLGENTIVNVSTFGFELPEGSKVALSGRVSEFNNQKKLVVDSEDGVKVLSNPILESLEKRVKALLEDGCISREVWEQALETLRDVYGVLTSKAEEMVEERDGEVCLRK